LGEGEKQKEKRKEKKNLELRLAGRSCRPAHIFFLSALLAAVVSGAVHPTKPLWIDDGAGRG